MKTTLCLLTSILLLLIPIITQAYAPNYQPVFLPNFNLLSAAERGDLDVVYHALYTERADINATDSYGQTALMLAAYNGHISIIRFLLTFGENLDVNVQNIYGGTALMLAAYQGHTNIVGALLFQGGADVNLKDSSGKTALRLAVDMSKFDIAQLIQIYQGKADLPWSSSPFQFAPSQILMLAAANGDIDNVRSILDGGLDVDTTDEYGKTALVYAAENGEIGVVEYLLAKGASTKIQDKKGRTVLKAAKNEQIRTLLMQYGAR